MREGSSVKPIGSRFPYAYARMSYLHPLLCLVPHPAPGRSDGGNSGGGYSDGGYTGGGYSEGVDGHKQLPFWVGKKERNGIYERKK